MLRPGLLAHAREHGATLRVAGQVASPAAARLGARLFEELRRSDDVSALAIDALALELIVAEARHEPRAPAPPWLVRVRERRHAHPAGRLTLAELASVSGRHPVQVSRQFHRHFGCTIGDYVRRVRVARAQVLLTGSDLGIADIALATGFADQSQLTHAFRRLAGTTPRRYRIRHAPA